MLRPSRPMIRPFISSFGQVHDRHGVLRGVVRGDPLHRGQDDVARLLGGLLAGPPLDRAGELDGVVLGLLADGLEEHALGVLGGHAADALEGDDPLLVELLQLVAALVELDLLLEELPVALLEHVRALVELLVAGVQPALQVGQLGAPLAGVVLRLALEADLLFLGLEDQVLLLGARVGDDAGGLLGRGLDRLVGPLAARGECQGRGQWQGRPAPQGRGRCSPSSSSHPTLGGRTC